MRDSRCKHRPYSGSLCPTSRFCLGHCPITGLGFFFFFLNSWACLCPIKLYSQKWTAGPDLVLWLWFVLTPTLHSEFTSVLGFSGPEDVSPLNLDSKMAGVFLCGSKLENLMIDTRLTGNIHKGLLHSKLEFFALETSKISMLSH